MTSKAAPSSSLLGRILPWAGTTATTPPLMARKEVQKGLSRLFRTRDLPANYQLAIPLYPRG
jgi:hypothetical protein